MEFSTLDLLTFVGFLLFVIGVSLYASRKEDSEEDYFLAGRKLSWWLIGISLIASNISSEHFIGMSGKGFGLGLAIASYEWMAAVTLIIVALFFLPKFLKTGIYTIPQFLEYRYNKTARLIMAGYMMVFYVIFTLATVLYSGALAINTVFDVDLVPAIWVIGLIAGAYTVYGGLKAVVWSDLIQGATLLIGGLIVMFIALDKVGGWEAFMANSGDKLHTVLPWDHPEMPWVAVFIGGLWVPNLYYWGLNQFITQRTLGAKSIEEGQKGILFGASLKLLIPIIVVFPGIMAYELFGDEIAHQDMAYPYLIKEVLPSGFMGIMFAALFGAVMSTLDSLLNSAATIFTMDIYKPYFNKEADSKKLIRTGRITTVILVIVGCLWAPIVAQFGSLYDYIQMSWGLIQGGILAAFLYGLLWKKVPPAAAIGAMILNVPIYGGLLAYDRLIGDGSTAFLHYMGITFVLLSIYVVAVTLWKPLKQPVVLPERQDVTYTLTPLVKVWSVLVFLATAALYIIFW